MGQEPEPGRTHFLAADSSHTGWKMKKRRMREKGETEKRICRPNKGEERRTKIKPPELARTGTE